MVIICSCDFCISGSFSSSIVMATSSALDDVICSCWWCCCATCCGVGIFSVVTCSASPTLVFLSVEVKCRPTGDVSSTCSWLGLLVLYCATPLTSKQGAQKQHRHTLWPKGTTITSRITHFPWFCGDCAVVSQAKLWWVHLSVVCNLQTLPAPAWKLWKVKVSVLIGF